MKVLTLIFSLGLLTVLTQAQAQNTMNMRPTHPSGNGRSTGGTTPPPVTGFNMRPTHHTNKSPSSPASSSTSPALPATPTTASGTNNTGLTGEAAYKNQATTPNTPAKKPAQTSEPTTPSYGTEEDYKGGGYAPAAPKDESQAPRGGAR